MLTSAPRVRGMEIGVDEVRLRPWRREDEAELALAANDRTIWLNLRDLFPHPYSRTDARAWLERTVGVAPVTNFAIEVAGALAGSVGIAPREDVHRRTAEIGYWIAASMRGRGIATAAVRAASDRAFDAFDLVRIEAGVFAWNPASMRVLEKAGYEREGVLRKSVVKDGRVTDSVLYALVRG